MREFHNVRMHLQICIAIRLYYIVGGYCSIIAAFFATPSWQLSFRYPVRIFFQEHIRTMVFLHDDLKMPSNALIAQLRRP